MGSVRASGFNPPKPGTPPPEQSLYGAPGRGTVTLMATLPPSPDPASGARSDHDRAHARVLIVEDDATFREVLAQELRTFGYVVRTAGDVATAERELASNEPDIMLLDERLPDRRGLDFLHDLRERGRTTPVIVLTGHGDIETAVRAIQTGAFHFLTKPCVIEDLDLAMRSAIAHRRAGARAAGPAAGAAGATSGTGATGVTAPADLIIGRSRAIAAIREMIDRVAAADAPVLLTGESGTGKELAARMVHRGSARAAMPFLALNCATLQDTLVEAELFGYEKGAFTGAAQAHAGLIEAAEGGVLFLDELAELTLPAQAKLLRVLQDGTYRRLGSAVESRANIRLIAATNVPLSKAIEQGRFRQDLFFRLNILEIRLPPLRDRADDIPLLAEHFFASRGQPVPEEIGSAPVRQLLTSYRWPGNIRELFNVLERVTILSGGKSFDRRILEDYFTMARAGGGDRIPDRLDELEMQHIHQVLERCGNNKTPAAKTLGISLKTLYNKLNREKEDPPEE